MTRPLSSPIRAANSGAPVAGVARVEIDERPLDRERGADRALAVVLLGVRKAEIGDDLASAPLPNHSAVFGHDGCGLVAETGDDCAQVLGIARHATPGFGNQFRSEGGDVAPLRAAPFPFVERARRWQRRLERTLAFDFAGFRVSRLGDGQLSVQRVRQARDDFVLHVEEIGERLVEALGPEMIARLGVDELDIDAHAISAALDAALENIADVQLAADLLRVRGLAFVCESRVAGDDEGAADPRQIAREALRDPVDEMLLLQIAADIGEWQDDDREARRGRFFGRALSAPQ